MLPHLSVAALSTTELRDGFAVLDAALSLVDGLL
jgi:hypothetical protein